MHTELSLWSFSEIEASEPVRAALLKSAPGPDAIASSIITRFKSELAAGCVRIGMEESGSNQHDLRVVLQFQVGEVLFDQFFNANTGYRAQFRRDWQRGFSYNRDIVINLRSIVAALLAPCVLARRLSPEFEDSGAIEVSREQACDSLDPVLSKVWFCCTLIAGNGTVTQLQTGVTGPRLRLGDHATWAAIARNEEDAWLDVKGAFVGGNEPYQLKDPIERAKKLHTCGEA
jgi:hypothetical protein